LAVFILEDAEPIMDHNEPVWRDGVLVGRISSAMFGHTVGRSVGLGYVRRDDGPVTADWLAAGTYEIEIAAERFQASASFRAPYDPTNARIRS
jgi:4-methylaminobutanoate oxidase (formaldehyde-forming)